VNVELLDVEVSAVYLDSATTRLLAGERFALLRSDAATTTRRGEHGTRTGVVPQARRSIGFWLVGLGLRLAGQSALEREGLRALPPACV
jgi:hypothetical protein